MSKNIIITVAILFMSTMIWSQVTIVVLGSSTAAGSGASTIDSSWVGRYSKYAKSINSTNKIINLARGGYTTYHILPTETSPISNRPGVDIHRNIDAALINNPDAIIINLPSNDAANGYSVTEQLSNYEKILLLSNSKNVPVWIATPQGRNLSLVGRNNLIEMKDSTFVRYGEKALDFWKYIGQSNGSLNSIFNSGDGVHLNDKGHKLLFERVVEKNILGELTDIKYLRVVNHELIIFPNPTSDLLTLKLKEEITDVSIKNISIFSIDGELKKCELKYNDPFINIDTQNLSNGMYLIKISLNDKSWVGKFIKTN